MSRYDAKDLGDALARVLALRPGKPLGQIIEDAVFSTPHTLWSIPDQELIAAVTQQSAATGTSRRPEDSNES